MPKNTEDTAEVLRSELDTAGDGELPTIPQGAIDVLARPVKAARSGAVDETIRKLVRMVALVEDARELLAGHSPEFALAPGIPEPLKEKLAMLDELAEKGLPSAQALYDEIKMLVGTN